MLEVKNPVKKFAFKPVVCRGCGYTIHKETYVEADNGIYGGKAYHLKCEDKAQEIIGEE